MSMFVVTGGAGFLGSHLVEALLLGGASKVVVIDDLSTGLRENISDDPRVTFIERSVVDDVSSYIEGARCIFHLAAQVSVQKSIEDPLTSHEVNVNGFLRVLEAARVKRVPRIVLVSSAAVYGSTAPTPVIEDAPYAPESPYGLHKAVCEQYAHLYQKLYGIEMVIVRPFNLYGPRQRADSPYAGVIAKFASCAKAGTQPTIYGDGSFVRDFLFVDDAVRALMLAGERPEAAGQTFNIGTGTGTTIIELAEKIYAECDMQCEPVFREARVGDITKSVTDASRIEHALGWKSEVSLEEGIKKLLS